MKANELRIGNFITVRNPYSGDFEPVIVGSIIPNHPHEFQINGYVESLTKPILLTEEILLKCGFEKGEYKNTYIDYTYNGYRIIKEKDYYQFLVYGSSVILSDINYLHQLQNLYFALTRKELEIKL